MTAQDISKAVTAARKVLGTPPRLEQWTAEDVAAAREVGESLLAYAAAADLLLAAKGGGQL